MILIVGSTKGGVGKTTLAVNFAIALSKSKREVLLVDADKQATATMFTQIRTNELGTPGYTCVALFGSAIVTQIPKLAEKYDDIVIDVGGRDNPSLRSALLIPNATLLIPVKPRSYDLWGADDTAELVTEARASGNLSLRAVTVINEADHLQEGDNAAATEQLREIEGLEYSPTRIVRRKAFPNSAATGRGVIEYHDLKAIDELMAVLTFVHPLHTDIGALSHGYR